MLVGRFQGVEDKGHPDAQARVLGRPKRVRHLVEHGPAEGLRMILVPGGGRRDVEEEIARRFPRRQRVLAHS